MTIRAIAVTRAAYHRLVTPPAAVDAHRRRQLAALVAAYGVRDARPAATPPVAACRRRPAIAGEPLVTVETDPCATS